MLKNKGKWFEEFLKHEGYIRNLVISNDFDYASEVVEEIIKIIDSKIVEKILDSYNNIAVFKLSNNMCFNIIVPTNRSKGRRVNRIFTIGNIDDKIIQCIFKPMLVKCVDGVDPVYFEL